MSYLRELVRKHRDRKDLASILERELDDLVDEIASGVAVDFRVRLGSMRG